MLILQLSILYVKTGYIPGQWLDTAFELSDLLSLSLVHHHQLLDFLPCPRKVVLQLLVLSLEQQ
ncbi:hypothetical protein UB48_15255 [Pseudomonas sp. 2(2015)]|nr:hypothetical protein UB48_15255 [Pseudomonas sp. 2(2015)]